MGRPRSWTLRPTGGKPALTGTTNAVPPEPFGSVFPPPNWDHVPLQDHPLKFSKSKFQWVPRIDTTIRTAVWRPLPRRVESSSLLKEKYMAKCKLFKNSRKSKRCTNLKIMPHSHNQGLKTWFRLWFCLDLWSSLFGCFDGFGSSTPSLLGLVEFSILKTDWKEEKIEQAKRSCYTIFWSILC